jgi:hypothetical protein
VPQLTTRTIDLDHLVEQAIQAHSDELLDLVRTRVAQTVDEFVAEVLAGLSENGNAAAVVVEPPEPNETSTAKRCTGCGELLPLDRFPSDTRRRDGRAARCRECRNEERRRRTDTSVAAEEPPRPFDGSAGVTSRGGTAATS